MVSIAINFLIATYLVLKNLSIFILRVCQVPIYRLELVTIGDHLCILCLFLHQWSPDSSL